MAPINMEFVKFLTVVIALLPAHAQCSILDLLVYTSEFPVSKLAVEEGSPGRLYVGCENQFVQLDSSLLEKTKLTIGPKYDTDKCFPPIGDTSCNQGQSRVSNIVKVLAINKLHNYIVMCGSVYQGLCSVHPLSNITHSQYFEETDHASYIGSQKSSTAFFGPPPRIINNTSRRMLYAAIATYDRSEDKFSPRTISTREIAYDPVNISNSSIQYFYENDDKREYSYLSVTSTIQSRFKVTYLFGFELNGYGYYLSIQPAEIDVSRSSYVTKLIQFCTDDTVYKTYVETAIKCSKGLFAYTIATAAHIQKSDNIYRLAVSFVRPKTGTMEADTDYGSVVCLFDMADVRTHFNELQKFCSNAGLGTYPWWLYGSQETCQLSSSTVSSF